MSTGWWPEAIHEVRVPVKNEKAPHGMCFQKFPILHPHEILSYLWDEVGIVVPESEIAKYWHTAWQLGEPWATSSPASDKHIPVGLHGDSARLWSQNKFEKITAIHLNIVHFRPCSVRFSRWCLFSCPTHLLFKNRTLNVVWKRLTWSVRKCLWRFAPDDRGWREAFITTWTKLCRAAFVSVWCQVGTDWAPWRTGSSMSRHGVPGQAGRQTECVLGALH